MEACAKIWGPSCKPTAPRNYTNYSSGAHWPDEAHKHRGLITNTNLPTNFHPTTMANGSSWNRSTQCSSVDPLSDPRFQDLWSDPVDCRSCIMCQNEKYASEVTSSSSSKAGGYAIDSRIQEGGYVLDEWPYCSSQLSCWNSQGSLGENCSSSTCTIGASASQPSQNYKNIWSSSNFSEPRQSLYASADSDLPGTRSTNGSSLEPFSALSITSQTDKYLSTIYGEEDTLPFPATHRGKGIRPATQVELTGESENDFVKATVSQPEFLLARNGHVKPIGVDCYLDEASSIAVLISDETKYIQSLVDNDRYRMERNDEPGGNMTNGYETSSSENAQSGDQDHGSTLGSAHESMNESSQEREAKDQFLVEQKNAGKTYKQIRKEGRFRIAESTLRGRYRNLTKEKVARVRKPMWKMKDVSPYCGN